MVAVPPGQQAVHSVSGAGAANAASAFHLPMVSARAVSDAQLTKWKIAFQNLCALYGLGVLVKEGKPPQRDAVKVTWPDLDGPAIDQKLAECLLEYQRENTVLYYWVYSSLDFSGEWESHDLEYTSRSFVFGDLRDGNGLLKWFLGFHDITTPGKQMALRLKLSKFKISLDFSQKQLLKMLLDYLTTWEKLLGNDRSNRILLNDFYVKVLDLWPHEPYDNPIVRTRSVVASMQLGGDAMLADVAATINEWMKAAKSYGVPVGKSHPPPGTSTVLTVGDRLTSADNDCTFCDVFGCKAKSENKKCVVFNSSVPIGAGSNYPKDMQVRFINGARSHLKENPDLKSMKNVRFTIERPAGSGKGKGGGGRGGGGRGGGRSAAPIISSSVNEVHFFGDEGENAQDFESWVQSMQVEAAESDQMAAPIFANLFGGGDPPNDGELTEAIRGEIVRASAVAAEAAVSAATPMSAQQPIVLMTPNPALTPVSSQAQGQVTPVQRSSLAALREARPQSGGGTTASATAISAAPDAARNDEERSVTERLMEAGAMALKQERLAKKKLQAFQKSRFGAWFEAIFKFFGIDKLNKYQRALLAFVLYAAMWPNALPLRLMRDKLIKQLVIARDAFISNAAARLVGLTSTGLLISLGSERNGNGNGNNDDGGAAALPPNPVASDARDVSSSGSTFEFNSRSTTPSSRSVTPLSPIPESTLPDASDAASQWQSGAKPTESDVASPKEVQSTGNGDEDSGGDDTAMDMSSTGSQKTVLMLKPSSKNGKYVHTGLSHTGECALTNTLLTGVPKNAILFDNGATVCCAKTDMGRLIGSFESNGEGGGGISVGDESSTLESQGSYLHAINITDADGNTVSVLLRMEDTPKAICSIFSEPEEVYKRGGKFNFTDEGRIWVLAGGKTMRLHMTANHLAWAKFSPVTDSAQVRKLLCESNAKLVMNVRRAITAAGSENGDESLSTACGQVVTESMAEMDAISTSLTMLPYVDPTFQSLTPSCPLLASDAKSAMINLSTAFLTYETDVSYDPCDSHWLAQVQRDLVREARWHQVDNAVVAVTGVKKDLFVQVNKTKNVRKLSGCGKLFAERLQTEVDLLSHEGCVCRLAAMAADGLMAQQRTCTSYQEPFDESTACNFEERLACITKLLNIKTSGNASRFINEAFDALKSKYSDAQLQDMVKQRKARVKRLTRPSDAITFAHRTGLCIDPKCSDAHEDFTFVDVLTDGRDALTSNAILSLAKAPPSTIGMAQPVKLSGVEILWRMHCVLGHVPLPQVLATLAKTKNLRAGLITKSDIETFVKLGCQQCIIWKMKRAPIRALVDATRAPPGKKWAYDTLTLKVKTTAGNIYITRFLDNGSGLKRSYGHSDFTSATLQKVMGMHRAWVRPTHGEIWIGKRDNHPSQAAKSFQDMLSVAQIHDQATAPYQHEAMPVEVTWQHDVPGAMILLATGPGTKALRHFEAAFLTHEDASNRTVKPRAHDGAALSAHMIYFNEDVARVNLLFAFFAPLMYLVFPEVRDSKFHEHALPGAYYGPSRSTEP